MLYSAGKPTCRNGRRCRLKICCSQGRVGSSPTVGRQNTGCCPKRENSRFLFCLRVHLRNTRAWDAVRLTARNFPPILTGNTETHSGGGQCIRKKSEWCVRLRLWQRFWRRAAERSRPPRLLRLRRRTVRQRRRRAWRQAPAVRRAVLRRAVRQQRSERSFRPKRKAIRRTIFPSAIRWSAVSRTARSKKN